MRMYAECPWVSPGGGAVALHRGSIALTVSYGLEALLLVLIPFAPSALAGSFDDVMVLCGNRHGNLKSVKRFSKRGCDVLSRRL